MCDCVYVHMCVYMSVYVYVCDCVRVCMYSTIRCITCYSIIWNLLIYMCV